MSLSVESLLESWDGRSVDPFQLAADIVPQDPAALGDLLKLARGGTAVAEVGATWVLKHHLERGVACDGRRTASLIRLIGSCRRDESRLHLLQCLPFVRLTSAQATRLHGTLLDHIDAGNAFVRAWVYNGLGLLVLHDVRYRREVLGLFERANASETAAVRARIRNISKELP